MLHTLSPDGDLCECVTQLPLIETGSTPFDFHKLWAETSAICNRLLNWDTDCSLSPQITTNLITKAYTLVYHSVSHPCLNTPRTLTVAAADEKRQIIAIQGCLQNLIRDHLMRIVVRKLNLTRYADECLIAGYVQCWSTFLVGVTNLKTIFSALSPTLAAMGCEDPRVYAETEDIALSLWESVVLTDDVMPCLLRNLGTVVKEERSGRESRYSPYVAEIKDGLLLLPNQSFYKQAEDSYVTTMCEYYLEKSERLQSEGIGLYEYSLICLNDIDNEALRARRYCKCPQVAVVQLVDVLVDDRIKIFESSVLIDWFSAPDSPEARARTTTLYSLLSKSPNRGLPLLQSLLTQTVEHVTAEEIKKVIPGTSDMLDRVILCSVRCIKKTRQLITGSFDTDVRMVEAMESGLRQGLLTGGAGVIDFCLLAERLAALLFESQSKYTLSPEACTCVYFFLPAADPPAKEAFLIAYQKQLAHRLLLGVHDLDRERKILRLLGAVKQSPILFNCRSMIRAIEVLSNQQEGDVMVKPVVLARGIWPATPQCAVNLPPVIRELISEKHREVCSSAGGRHVTTALAYTSGTVKLVLPNAQQPVILRLSLVQIAIVLLFNTCASWSIADLSTTVGVNGRDCIYALNPLVAAGLFDGPSLLQEGSVVTLCRIFRGEPNSQQNLIPGYQFPKSHLATRPTTIGSPTSCEAGTSLVVESQIAHTLKSKGAQSLDDIHQHVNSILHPTEIPRSDVKKLIEKLVNRDIVVRDQVTKKFVFVP